MTYNALNRDVFDDAKRRRYLDLVATGMNLADAAAATPIHHNVPRRHERTDPAFAQALADAKAQGKKIRQENVAHDEYRYNCLNCRCDVCCTAATKGRAARRAAAQPEGAEGQSGPPGEVRDIRVQPKSFPSFLLARAS
ncbi:hypothetical protein OH809_45255 (plasmid) [Streptomyces sp. NBC_00873]|uniref:hypothetical protein n=1 Tax=Streptomyces sp. NBC_00873 TaxID=2975852 RepID=UPI0037DC19E0|nr:hypothetical protein OH809_45255 [Streptomyces sp. NBC_00873]